MKVVYLRTLAGLRGAKRKGNVDSDVIAAKTGYFAAAGNDKVFVNLVITDHLLLFLVKVCVDNFDHLKLNGTVFVRLLVYTPERIRGDRHRSNAGFHDKNAFVFITGSVKNLGQRSIGYFYTYAFGA